MFSSLFDICIVGYKLYQYSACRILSVSCDIPMLVCQSNIGACAGHKYTPLYYLMLHMLTFIYFTCIFANVSKYKAIDASCIAVFATYVWALLVVFLHYSIISTVCFRTMAVMQVDCVVLSAGTVSYVPHFCCLHHFASCYIPVSQQFPQVLTLLEIFGAPQNGAVCGTLTCEPGPPTVYQSYAGAVR